MKSKVKEKEESDTEYFYYVKLMEICEALDITLAIDTHNISDVDRWSMERLSSNLHIILTQLEEKD